jgi:hypothetical protein
MWEELAIAPTDDPRIIRRAYAARLKQLDPDRDREAFARLRAALEGALAGATARPRPAPSLPRDEVPADDGPPGVAVAAVVIAPAAQAQQDMRQDMPQETHPATREEARVVPAPEPPALRHPPAPPALQSADEIAQERALLIGLESALQRCDAHEATRLYFRAAATGALPLGEAERMLARLFAVALEDAAFDRGAFRELARCFGWDKPQRASEVLSDLRQRVFARLAAEDWYDALVARADRKKGTARAQVKIARLLLRRIRRPWLRGIMRPALTACLQEYRQHEIWLRDRIDPDWATRLEARVRRREIVASALITLFIGYLLLNALAVGVISVINDGLSLAFMVGVVPFGVLAAVLAWVLKRVAGHLVQVWRRRTP